ncbi:type II toxin-antitoxin system RelE/ParE family toxin [Serratia marcescens]|uniref:type II toxin-antitoxin system RelE/ParE family toxin n=1 Tax=Serratia marcescens TaxID=615 RepID=UPI003D090F5B
MCSTSIERIVTGRNAALAQIEMLIRHLDDVSWLTSGIGGDIASHWAMRQGHSFDCWLMQPVDKAMPVITVHPAIGVQQTRYEPREVRKVLFDDYEVHYELRDNDIYIVDLWHTREER